MSDTEMYENPLVPNAKLRQMYMAMAEARVLDEHVTGLEKRGHKFKSPKGVKGFKGPRMLDSIRGQEACRVSTAMDLGPEDLVSDSQVGLVMDLLVGAKVSSLLKHAAELESGKLTKGIKLGGTSGQLLPWIEDAGERLRMAMGAALSFKIFGRPNVVVAYVRNGEVGKGVWRRMLELAGRLELPVIFVVLPAGPREKNTGKSNLSAKTARWGVPGIPVDADDAVALYRVAQESLGRARGGDGPVLIECVAYQAGGSRDGAPGDPLVQMEEFLLRRKVCSKAWLKHAGDGLRRRIVAVKG